VVGVSKARSPAVVFVLISERRKNTLNLMRGTGLALLSFLVADCGSAGLPEPRRSDPTGFILSDGEIQLESMLHQLDLLDPKIYPFKDAPGDPIAICTRKNRDVMAKKLALNLILGKPLAQDKAVEMSYYELIAEGSPSELIPVVQLRKYFKEALFSCLFDLSNGKPPEATEESNISILTASNFETETSHGIVVLDLMTHWCGPCKEMVPHLEKLAQNYNGELRVGRLDLDRSRAIADRFDIKSLPTLIILNDGQEVARTGKGFPGYGDLQKWIQGALQGKISPPSRLGGEQSTAVD
jgi:thioredoxin